MYYLTSTLKLKPFILSGSWGPLYTYQYPPQSTDGGGSIFMDFAGIAELTKVSEEH